MIKEDSDQEDAKKIAYHEPDEFGCQRPSPRRRKSYKEYKNYRLKPVGKRIFKKKYYRRSDTKNYRKPKRHQYRRKCEKKCKCYLCGAESHIKPNCPKLEKPLKYIELHQLHLEEDADSDNSSIYEIEEIRDLEEVNLLELIDPRDYIEIGNLKPVNNVSTKSIYVTSIIKFKMTNVVTKALIDRSQIMCNTETYNPNRIP